MSLPASATGTVAKQQVTTTTTVVSQNRLTKSDPHLYTRAVGFLEYSRALDQLERLRAGCDEEELEAVEEIIQSEPEFRVYRELARRFGIGPKSGVGTDYEGTDNSVGHGLNWLTSLARVELAAILAAFSQHPRPFAIADALFDREETVELLIDGARMHFWSLTQDPAFATIRKRATPNTFTLAYLRRLNVATAFVKASAEFSQDPRIAQEMRQYFAQLETARQTIRARIAAYLARQSVHNVAQKSSRQRLLELCNEGACRTFE